MIYKKEIRLGLIIWGVFLAIIAVCLATFTIIKVKNDIAYNKALIEQMGKPTVIEQRYFSPMKGQ